ncbi:hypothetical protein C6I21_05775 [Alkalicoccus urumqiensis]|uniref:DUF4083 domain-containing protein n=2 Tax=Alkalicoccus urumqiensis TaxID=1548213 RepID=A0A2P6MJ54_ALKUR|nr:hypothetical protein C6I21_05775 [Alkalicoccus urumqiensis]
MEIMNALFQLASVFVLLFVIGGTAGLIVMMRRMKKQSSDTKAQLARMEEKIEQLQKSRR